MYKVGILVLSIFIISCSSDVVAPQFEYEIIEKSFNYDDETGNINAYCLIESIYHLFFITVQLINSDNESTIVSFDLLMDNEQNNEFSYIGSNDLTSLEIGNYYMRFIVSDINGLIQMVEETNSQNISPPFPPEILSLDMSSSIQLHATEWVYFPVNLFGTDLNGIDDILKVEYKIKGVLISECTAQVEEYAEYTNLGNNNWILTFQEEIEGNFTFHIDIPFRPIDGSALLDENEDIIFPESECGKIGEIYFQFTMIDMSGLQDIIEDIPLEIMF